MIEVRDLAKRFGHTTALEHVGFTAADGAVTGLLGTNGAGKSTTLRILSGLVAADRGAVTVEGEAVTPGERGATRHLGVLADATGLYPRLSPREHLVYAARLQGLGRRRARERVARVIERLGLGRIADRRCDGFSRGERQRVTLGRALVHDPPNLVLDEPTTGLDVLAVRRMRRHLRSLADEGRAVLFSSHVLSEVDSICDQVVVLASGTVVAAGSPAELVAQTGARNLEEAFVALVEPTLQGAL